MWVRPDRTNKKIRVYISTGHYSNECGDVVRQSYIRSRIFIVNIYVIMRTRDYTVARFGHVCLCVEGVGGLGWGEPEG